MDALAPPSTLPKQRLKPGERRHQILQVLAGMLEQPGAERITTAALAAQVGVTEAALYRHFASKAQMFEALIEFTEASLFGLVRQISDSPFPDKAARIAAALLQFAEKNPGMTRVLVGDALILEHERLQARVNQAFDRIESSLRQVLREAAEAGGSPLPTVQSSAAASVWMSFVVGRMQRFARSGFKRLPTEQLEASLKCIG
jgi:TetR/AcrR family transcriptional regulator